MTPEKQRIKIAEAHGWLKITQLDSDLHGWQEPGPLEPLPNYTEDLNAMHEAEEVCIGTIHAKKHGQMLQEVTGWHCVGIVPDHARDLTHLSKLSRATAPQRAEAFLRTLNLWEL